MVEAGAELDPQTVGEPKGALPLTRRNLAVLDPRLPHFQENVELDIKRSLARDLHDLVAQTLTSMVVDFELFKAEQADRQSLLERIDQWQGSTREVLVNLRELLYDMREQVAVEVTFAEALTSTVQRFQEKTGIKTELTMLPDWPSNLTRTASVNIHRIIEEALSNARRHSGGTAVWIVLKASPDGEPAVEIRDNGRGVDTHESRPLGLGTIGMRERALLLGGRVHIEGKAGVGTTVQAVFPKASLTPQERMQ